MKKKVILTSIVSLCIIMPAFAEFTAGQQIADENGLLNGMACDSDTLGVTQDTANLEAIWTPNTYNISYYCEEGQPVRIGIPIICGNPEYENTEQCSDRERATYGNSFLFVETAKCSKPGYTISGWSCTRDDTPNGTPVLYTLGQRVNSWEIPSDLTCMATYTGNTIDLNWYNSEQATTPSSTTQCTYGTTSGQGALALPAQPTAPQGYTFGGWRVFDICAKFNTSGTCNMNAQCFWYVDSNTNTGTCVNTATVSANCNSATGDQTQCQSYGYCSYTPKSGGQCSTGFDSMCVSLSQTECSVHSNLCHWVTDLPNGLSVNGISEGPVCVGPAVWNRIQHTMAQ